MNNDFKFFVPVDIEKATNKDGSEKMVVKGIASTDSRDSQGEWLDPSNFDLSEFKWVNYNHLGKNDPGTIIGEPTIAYVNEKNQLYIEGYLYPEMPLAISTWNLMKALRNSPRGNKLSLSVEGKVISRDPNNPKRITRSKITGVAICPTPINGDTWVDLITKGQTEDKELEYEEDDDQETEEKAMSVASNPQVTVESVEHKEEKRKITKSDVFEKIFTQYEGINIEKAKSVYNLIEKISNMENNDLSNETISKAFAILTISQEEIAKAEKPAAPAVACMTKATDSTDEDGGDIEVMKAKSEIKKSFKKMMNDGMAEDDMKKSLIAKGYQVEMINKGYKKALKKSMTGEQQIKAAAGITKSEEVEIEKSEEYVALVPDTTLVDIIKSNQDEINKKFSALGEIFKSQSSEIEDLKKSLSDVTDFNNDLKGKLNKIESTPMPRKSVTTTNYNERFAKSDNGNSGETYNIANTQERKNLADKLEEMSGINKGTGNFDQDLMKGAQDLEISKSVDAKVLKRLQAAGITVINEG